MSTMGRPIYSGIRGREGDNRWHHGDNEMELVAAGVAPTTHFALFLASSLSRKGQGTNLNITELFGGNFGSRESGF